MIDKLLNNKGYRKTYPTWGMYYSLMSQRMKGHGWNLSIPEDPEIPATWCKSDIYARIARGLVRGWSLNARIAYKKMEEFPTSKSVEPFFRIKTMKGFAAKHAKKLIYRKVSLPQIMNAALHNRLALGGSYMGIVEHDESVAGKLKVYWKKNVLKGEVQVSLP